jgi:protein tyrosine/serine phosphatase
MGKLVDLAAGALIVCGALGHVSAETADLRQATSAATTQSSPVAHPEWAQAIDIDGLPNLHRVTSNLYRSAQPTAEGMQQLRKLGIKTVVSLRAFHDDTDRLRDVEGVRYYQIHMKTWHAEKEDAVTFLKLVTDSANQPVLVHCQHGADRTGTMCAVYRMAVQGWTKEQAVREMTEGGFGFHEVWSNLRKWLDTVDVQDLRSGAGIQ